MSLPDAASLEGFLLAELREVVGRLVGEVRRLHSGAVALQAKVDAQQVTISALRAENQALRDEVARLKGLPPRPPSRPSGMEQATQPEATDTDEKRSKRPRGAKRDAQAITAERVLKAAVPDHGKDSLHEFTQRPTRCGVRAATSAASQWAAAVSPAELQQRRKRTRRPCVVSCRKPYVTLPLAR